MNTKKINRTILAISLFFIFGCVPNLEYNQNGRSYLTVESIEPANGAMLSSLKSVHIRLSQPLRAQTVNPQTVLIIKNASLNMAEVPHKEVNAQVKKGNLESVGGLLALEDNNQKITWKPESPWESFASYQVVLTSSIQSESYAPLIPPDEKYNFTSTFSFVGDSLAPMDEYENTDDFFWAPEDENNFFKEDEIVDPVYPPEELMIHEIYYDDVISDSDGTAFVELYGTAGSSLADYIVRFVNGADGKEIDRATLPKGAIIPENGFFVIADIKTNSNTESLVSPAHFLDQFDPQNGPDSIQLLSPLGQLIDVIGYGEGLPDKDNEGLPMYFGTPAPDVKAGYSLSRISYQNTQNNFNDFVINTKPSPGFEEVISLEAS